MECLQKSFGVCVIKLCTMVWMCVGTSTLLADVPADPQVVINSSGDAVGVWEVFADPGYIQAAIYDAGTGMWGTTTTISTSDDSFFVQLTANPNGDTIAAWLFLDTVNEVFGLVTSRLSGTTWETPVVMSSATESINDFHFEINDSGQIMLIWQSFNSSSGNSEIWASTASFSGSWSTPAQLF